jgi:uncharacterized protein YgiB involved in biofilm formation
MHKLAMTSVLIALSGLSGCGPNVPSQSDANQPQHVAERGIFLSTDECVLSEKLSVDECSEAILKALTEHDAKTVGYQTEAECVAAFGPDRCEVRVGDTYRPRVQAFLVTLEMPANAETLFPPSRAIVGFQSSSGQQIDATDKTLRVSEAALALAHENAGSPAAAAPDDSSNALASAASNIH